MATHAPDDFVNFVVGRLSLPADARPDVTRTNDAGNTFGAICVRLGILTVRDIELILDIQKESRHRRFGELAVERGRMTEAQVQSVLDLQLFYRSFEQGALLVVDGHLEMGRLTQLWSEYAARS